MYTSSQLIASTGTKFSLKNDSNAIVIDFINDCDVNSLLKKLTTDNFLHIRNLSLHFENLKGNDRLPVIDIYINLKEENIPEEDNYLGSMALYGLGESSIETEEYDGAGQNRIFDVSEIFCQMLNEPNWNKKHFKLFLIPSRPLPDDAILTIEHINLYFNETNLS